MYSPSIRPWNIRIRTYGSCMHHVWRMHACTLHVCVLGIRTHTYIHTHIQACMHITDTPTYNMHACMFCMYGSMSVSVCRYVCVCMHACMYVSVCQYVSMSCMYVCHAYMYESMCVCVHAYMYVCMHTCTYVCMYVCCIVCMHVCIARIMNVLWMECMYA
jgi:hypothetical protein